MILLITCKLTLLASWAAGLLAGLPATIQELLKLCLVCCLSIGSLLLWLRHRENQNPSRRWMHAAD